MSIYKKTKEAEHYTYNFYIDRRRFSGSTGCSNRREAEAFERKRKIEARAELDALAAQEGVGGPMTLKQATSRYYREVGQYQKAADKVETGISNIIRLIGGDTLIKDIDDNVVSKMVASRREEAAHNVAAKTVTKHKRRLKPRKAPKKVSPATVNRSTTEPLRKVLNRARDVWGQEIKRITWRTHMLKEPRERIRELSMDEETRLFESLNPRHHAIVRFVIRTGVRISECVGLTWDRVDFGTGTIIVFGKGDKLAPIPMSKDIRELLMSIRGRHPDRVFCWRDDNEDAWHPYTTHGLDSALGRATAKAGIANLHFHDLRHTAATRLLRKTGNLKMVQKLLRHENIETTQRYAHVLDEDLRAGLDALADEEAEERQKVTSTVTSFARSSS
jgi:integrase